MKMIEPIQAQNIADLIAEENLAIDAFALEKDFHVGSALFAISKIKDPVFDLVFCGGTCLSKAYGLLDRLSEDVDIKVVLKPGVSLGSNQLRNALSSLKDRVAQALVVAGFDADQFKPVKGEDGKMKRIAIDAMDSNKYITCNVRYGSHFEQPDAMRSRLQIELNHTSLSLPSVKRKVESIFDRLREVDNTSFVEMDCVDLTEAAVEKLISFPRRLALHLRSVEVNPSDSINHRPFDQTLVRHIYDIHEINRLAPQAFENKATISNLMKLALEKDAIDFIHQHPEFADAPVSELQRAIQSAAQNPLIKEAYERFVKVMVYGEQKPDFESALAVFEERLMDACSQHSDLSFEVERQRLQDQKIALRGPSSGM